VAKVDMKDGIVASPASTSPLVGVSKDGPAERVEGVEGEF